MYTDVGPSATWEAGFLAYDYAEMNKVDSAVVMSYVEALFKNDWYLDEEDGSGRRSQRVALRLCDLGCLP